MNEETLETPTNGDRRKTNNELLATVKATSDVLADVKTELGIAREELKSAKEVAIEREHRQEKRQTLIRWLLIFMLLMTFAIGVNGYFNRHLVHKIESCLNTTGKCYKERQENQKNVISQIIDQNQNGIPDHQEILNQTK